MRVNLFANFFSEKFSKQKRRRKEREKPTTHLIHAERHHDVCFRINCTAYPDTLSFFATLPYLTERYDAGLAPAREHVYLHLQLSKQRAGGVSMLRRIVQCRSCLWLPALLTGSSNAINTSRHSYIHALV